MSIKRAFFWLHLAVGLAFGLFIGLLALTGASIAYGPQLIEAGQRDITRIQVRDTPRLPIETLLKKAGEQVPGLSPAGVFVYAEPDRAVMIAGGRGKPSYYVDPYTGETKEQGAKRTRDFIRFMTSLHRWLALPGGERGGEEGRERGTRGERAPAGERAEGMGMGERDRSRAESGLFTRNNGKLVMDCTGVAFAVICVTGLIIWWPRHLRWRAIRPSVWFLKGMKGKTRDWNRHNVFGFWSLPIITTLAVTGAMIGFPRARSLLYYAVGEKPPVRGEGRPGGEVGRAAGAEQNRGDTRPEGASGETRRQGGEGFGREVTVVAPPSPDAKPIGYEQALAVVTKDTPAWEYVSFRTANAAGAGGAREGGRRAGGERRAEAEGEAAAGAETRAPRAEDESAEPRRGNRRRRAGTSMMTVTLKRSDTAPLFANVSYTLNPYTGEIVKKETFADKSAGEKLGGSVRNVHTGEGFGLFGQTLMFLGCTATLILAYTGFALSWRRFCPAKKKRRHQHRGDHAETPPQAA